MNARSRDAVLSGAPGYEQVFTVHNESGSYGLREQVSIFPAGPNEFRLVGVIVDASARHAAEEALTVEKERLDVTLSALADGVIVTDRSGMVRYLNPAAIKLTEHEADEAIDQSASAVCVLRHEETAQDLDLPVAAAVADDALVALPEHAILRGPCRRSHGSG